MDVNVKDLNKFIGSDGLTVLDEVRVSSTEPAFRQNGYKTNGDKKSFALDFDSSNQEYVILENTITCNTNEPLKLTFKLESIGTQFDLCSESDSASDSRITVLSSGTVVLRVTGSTTVNTGLPLNIGVNTIELNFNGTDNDITVNGTTVNIPSCTSPFIISQIGKRGLFYADITLFLFEINYETFELKRGLGVDIIGSNVKRAEIKTSAANPQQRVNFGMWLKGDDVNGWNPYTV
tara:strand:+ start:3913 stop:4617 length:705 start_codon:yes stop_codon:yes gene_type:complete